MTRHFFNRVVPPLLFMALLLSKAFPSTIYTVTGQPGYRLSDAAGAIQSATSGAHIVEFSAYTSVGTFLMDGSGADSIIFRRKDLSVQPLLFPASILFTFRNYKGVVLFKGLAFKPAEKSGVLLDGALAIKSNKHLIFDSCQIYGDTLVQTGFLSWTGSAGSKIQFKRTYIALKTGGGTFDVTGDTVQFMGSIVNSQAGGVIHATTLVSLHNNTFVRGRIFAEGLPPTSSTANVSIVGNLFLHPSGGRLGPLFLRDMSPDIRIDSIRDNGKDPKYTKWDEGSFATMFISERGNANISGSFPDSSEMWNWVLPSEKVKGAYNLVGSSAMPNYTLYPGANTLRKRIGKDSVSLALDNAEIPRMVDVAYGSATYPSDIDSLRSVYLKDTNLVVSGPATVTSIELPGISAYGPAVLVGVSGGTFISQTRNPTPNVPIFVNSGSANQFIPAWGGQNTKKGTSVAPSSLPAGKSLTFSSVQWAGITSFFTTQATPSGNRVRLLQKGAQTVSLAESTTVLASGNIAYGVGASLDSSAWNSDSVFFWVQGVGYRKPSSRGTQFVDTLPFRNPLEVVLAERLAIGKGNDTVPLAQGRILTQSTTGHQLKVDSSYQPTQALFPDMGLFTKGVAMTWPGRAQGDSLFLEMRKSHPLQKPYTQENGKAVSFTPSREDSISVSVALGMGDSGKAVFLAASKSDLAAIQGELKLIAPLPDFLRLGNLRLPWGKGAVSGRIQLYGTNGKTVLDAAIARERSMVSFQDSGWNSLFGWWTVLLVDRKSHQQPIWISSVDRWTR